MEVAVGYCNSAHPFDFGCVKTAGDSALVTVWPADYATDAFLLQIQNGERSRLAFSFNSQIHRPHPSSADGVQWRIKDFEKGRADNFVGAAEGGIFRGRGRERWRILRGRAATAYCQRP